MTAKRSAKRHLQDIGYRITLPPYCAVYEDYLFGLGLLFLHAVSIAPNWAGMICIVDPYWNLPQDTVNPRWVNESGLSSNLKQTR